MSLRATGSIRVVILTITALILTLSIALVVERKKPARPAAEGTLSIAVVPFTDTGFSADRGHLAAGLSVDLLDRLMLIETLQCIPRDQILALRARIEDPRHLGKMLGAEILVTGSLSEQAGEVQVHLTIHDSRFGTLLADQRFGGSRDGVLDLHRQMAEWVVESLHLSPTNDEMAKLRQNATRSLKAWETFSRGVGNLDDLLNPRAPAFAIELLHRAVQLDPAFAQARARLSFAMWREFMRIRDPSSLQAAALHAARSLEQSPDADAAVVAFVLTSQTQRASEPSGFQIARQVDRLIKPDQAARALAVHWLQVGELGLAESAWITATEMAPHNWLNSYGYGHFLLRGGRQAEAEQAFAQAAETSSPDNTWPQEAILTLRLSLGDLAGAVEVFEALEEPPVEAELARQMATAYSILGRLEPAEDLYRRAVSLEPSSPRIRQELGDVLSRSGRLDEASTEYSLALEMLESDMPVQSMDPVHQRHFALLAAKAGRCPEALPLAARLFRHQTESAALAHDLARIFAACGDAPAAFEALDVAIRHGLSPELVRSQAEFDWLATDEEFMKILQGAEAVPPSP
jgi:TolB-like protein/tetratricopeptide (TPR) repeat protein